jgi:hypothetical protein
LAAELEDDEEPDDGLDDEFGDELLDGDAEFEVDELVGVEDLLHPATLKITAMGRAAMGATKRVRMSGSCAICGERRSDLREVADILVRNAESDNGWARCEILRRHEGACLTRRSALVV